MSFKNTRNQTRQSSFFIFRPPMLLHRRPISIALPVSLSAAFCILAELFKRPVLCIAKSNSNVESTFRLVPISTCYTQTGSKIGAGRIICH